MKNKLGFLGFLGLLGILGFIENNNAYFGFFGFLFYLRYFMVIPDELFRLNIRKAATPAFFIGMALFAITVVMSAFHVSTFIFVIGLVAGFVVSFLVFTFLLVFYELRESSSK